MPQIIFRSLKIYFVLKIVTVSNKTKNDKNMSEIFLNHTLEVLTVF